MNGQLQPPDIMNLLRSSLSVNVKYGIILFMLHEGTLIVSIQIFLFFGN